MDVAAPPTVVTTTSFAPTVPAGVAAVNDVPEPFTTTLVAAEPPTVTVAPVKFVPVIVIAVPAANGPDDGLTLEMIGAATYVNESVNVKAPPAVVTATFCAPAVPGGVVAVITVALLVNTVALAPPTVTVALAKFVPVIVIVVPPATGPLDGLIILMVGA